jgi:hypothetical protein
VTVYLIFLLVLAETVVSALVLMAVLFARMKSRKSHVWPTLARWESIQLP